MRTVWRPTITPSSWNLAKDMCPSAFLTTEAAEARLSQCIIISWRFVGKSSLVGGMPCATMSKRRRLGCEGAHEVHEASDDGVSLRLALPCLLVIIVILFLRGIGPLGQIGDLEARNRTCHEMFVNKLDTMCKEAEPRLIACTGEFKKRATEQSDELRKWVASQSSRIKAEARETEKALETVTRDLGH